MEKSGFFNSVNKDRRYLAEDFAKYFSLFIDNGVFPQEADWLKVKTAGGMSVALSLGYAWINGYNYENDSDKVFQIDVSDGVNKRIDAIMIRWDKAKRNIESVYVKGNFSSDPVAPAPVRTADYFDLKVAEIYVRAGAVQIETQDITDTRFNKSVCGIVAGVVDQIDTTDLFSQYDATFKEFMKTIEGALSGDVAGNLLNLINTHTSDSEIHVTSEDKQKWNGYKTIAQLSYQKSGTVHKLTGLSGASGLVSAVFSASSGFSTGDTFTVDGTAYSIQLSNGETAEDNLFVAGTSVPVVIDTVGKKVNFKAAGGGFKFNPAYLQATAIPRDNSFSNFSGWGREVSIHGSSKGIFISTENANVGYADLSSYPSTFKKAFEKTNITVFDANPFIEMFFGYDSSGRTTLYAYDKSGNQVASKNIASVYSVSNVRFFKYCSAPILGTENTLFVWECNDGGTPTVHAALFDKTLKELWHSKFSTVSSYETATLTDPKILAITKQGKAYVCVNDATHSVRGVFEISISNGSLIKKSNPGIILSKDKVACDSNGNFIIWRYNDVNFYNNNFNQVASKTVTNILSISSDGNLFYIFTYDGSNSPYIATITGYDSKGVKQSELLGAKGCVSVDSSYGMLLSDFSNNLYFVEQYGIKLLTSAYLQDYKKLMK